MSIASPMRRATATLAASALVAGSAVALGTAAPALAAPAPATVTEELNWNLKDSWVNYVSVINSGTVTAGDGATHDDLTATTLWSPAAAPAEFDPAVGSGEAQFEGWVRYLAPGHSIDITLADPRIAWDANGDAELILAANDHTDLIFATADVTISEPEIDGTTATVEVMGTNVRITNEAGTINFAEVPDQNTSFSMYLNEPLSDFVFELEYEIQPVTVATPTTTPAAGPVLKGTSVTVSTTVTAGDPAEGVDAGRVEFFATPAAGGSPISLGTDTTPGPNGEFSVSTSALTGGGYRFSAEYSHGGQFAPGSSAQASTANFGVVDTALTGICTPGANAKTATNAASTQWGFNGYLEMFSPVRSGTGDISFDGTVFQLANGDVTADANCARIAYSGTLTYNQHGGLVVINVIDPFLIVNRSGQGAIYAKVVVDAQGTHTETSSPVPLAKVSNVSGLPAVGAAGTATVTYAYEGATAQGTWSQAYGNAWANAFIWSIPSSARAYFHASTQAHLNKAPQPMTVSFTWPKAKGVDLPNRIEGADRYATSAAIVDKFDDEFNPNIVFIATGENYPDALAAAAAAAHMNAPVLLTKKDSLPSVVKAQLNSIKPATIYVLGSSATVSNKVVNELKKVSGSPSVKRLAGDDRYATMREIVKTAFGVNGNGDGKENRNLHTVVIATGKNFPDALSAGGAVASVGGAVILVDGSKSSIPTATMNLIKDLKPQRVVIAGSADAVKSKIETQLKNAFPGKVSRKAGKNRYETSVLLNKLFYPNADVVFFATGKNFPDALSAAPLAGLLDAPLLVTEKSCVSSSAKQYVQSLAPQKKVLLGSSASLSNSVASLKTC